MDSKQGEFAHLAELFNDSVRVAFVYGDVSDVASASVLHRCLSELHIEMIGEPYYDAAESGEECDYKELQKVIFFCDRHKCPLIIVTAGRILQDMKALDLLKNSGIVFCCLDYPWLCRQNIELLQSLLMYEKEKRTNV